jgi:hypothetical protein
MIFVQKRSSRESLPIVRLAVEIRLRSFATGSKQSGSKIAALPTGYCGLMALPEP